MFGQEVPLRSTAKHTKIKAFVKPTGNNVKAEGRKWAMNWCNQSRGTENKCLGYLLSYKITWQLRAGLILLWFAGKISFHYLDKLR